MEQPGNAMSFSVARRSVHHREDSRLENTVQQMSIRVRSAFVVRAMRYRYGSKCQDLSLEGGAPTPGASNEQVEEREAATTIPGQV